MKKQLWIIEPHTSADKSFDIIPPGVISENFKYSGFIMTVDYDDVDHDNVDKMAEKIVSILNDNLDKF